jgi:two-component system, OmpR family, sensor kinase
MGRQGLMAWGGRFNVRFNVSLPMPLRVSSLRVPSLHVPFGLRIFFRSAFALLALATLALALGVLKDEKARSLHNYAEGLRQNQAQIAARLRHPAGQLALLNPTAVNPDRAGAVGSLSVRPMLLPFAALDFDDRNKALQAVELAGCALQYPDGTTLCVGLGSNPYAGGFVYVVGSFAATELLPRVLTEFDLRKAHRVAVALRLRGQTTRWLAPYELTPDGRGRLAGFDADTAVDANSNLLTGARQQRDFRGWLWQDARCADAAAPTEGCARRTYVSMRLPVEQFREALLARQPVWPPPDIDQIELQLQVLAPNANANADATPAPAPLFDSRTAGATLPFSMAELGALLLPGEKLQVRRAGANNTIFELTGARRNDERISPWLAALISRLPVDVPVDVPADGTSAPLEARDSITTPFGRYELLLQGDLRAVNQGLAAVATRLSWLVGAMLLAVMLTWLAIEIRVIRRVTLLTQRAAAVSTGMRAGDGSVALTGLDLSDLRGHDELGVLAQGLKDLLARVNDDMRREQIRAAQEKDMWHAVGHEIMSPLQSLMALHGNPSDASQRYIHRMQQAVRVLYGQASPSEAFESSQLSLAPLNLNEFLGHVAENAKYIGIADIEFQTGARPVMVRADEHSLEDVVTHVLRNADRHRRADTPIRLILEVHAQDVQVTLHNQGTAIAPDMLDRIFEYGVSDLAGAGAEPGQRGQGLFVARTYMAKMGGTITASNEDGGVSFTLRLPKAA